MRKMMSGLAFGLACALVFHCAIAQEMAEPVAEPAEPTAPGVVSDAWISTKIKAALVPLIRDQRASIGVEVANGVVVLTGTVEGEVTRQQVIALCTRTNGVLAVEAESLKVAGYPAPR